MSVTCFKWFLAFCRFWFDYRLNKEVYLVTVIAVLYTHFSVAIHRRELSAQDIFVELKYGVRIQTNVNNQIFVRPNGCIRIGIYMPLRVFWQELVRYFRN